MKKFIILFSIFMMTLAASAQSELPTDSARHLPNENYKEFGGFLLDMGLMNVIPPSIPQFDLTIPDASKDFNRLFRLNPDVTYSQGVGTLFAPSWSVGRNGFGHTQNYQMGSFKLKNGMRFNTYGEYDADGYKVPNRNALPYERNRFKGAFELKSANGAFGIRIEVQQGRTTPY